MAQQNKQLSRDGYNPAHGATAVAKSVHFTSHHTTIPPYPQSHPTSHCTTRTARTQEQPPTNPFSQSQLAKPSWWHRSNQELLKAKRRRRAARRCQQLCKERGHQHKEIKGAKSRKGSTRRSSATTSKIIFAKPKIVVSLDCSQFICSWHIRIILEQ